MTASPAVQVPRPVAPPSQSWRTFPRSYRDDVRTALRPTAAAKTRPAQAEAAD